MIVQFGSFEIETTEVVAVQSMGVWGTGQRDVKVYLKNNSIPLNVHFNSEPPESLEAFKIRTNALIEQFKQSWKKSLTNTQEDTGPM